MTGSLQEGLHVLATVVLGFGAIAANTLFWEKWIPAHVTKRVGKCVYAAAKWRSVSVRVDSPSGLGFASYFGLVGLLFAATANPRGATIFSVWFAMLVVLAALSSRPRKLVPFTCGDFGGLVVQGVLDGASTPDGSVLIKVRFLSPVPSEAWLKDRVAEALSVAMTQRQGE